MTCILRVTSDGSPIGQFVPYRVENGTAHFQVSDGRFEDFKTQTLDAVRFLQENELTLQAALSQSGASGVLDFAVAWRDVAVQVDTFPPELVRLAGRVGLALEISRYPSSDDLNEA